MIEIQNIIDVFDTSIGKILVVNGSSSLNVGEHIKTPIGTFSIKGIHMPPRPDDDTMRLIVHETIV